MSTLTDAEVSDAAVVALTNTDADEGFGTVVAVGAFRQCPDVGVGGFRAGIGDVWSRVCPISARYLSIVRQSFSNSAMPQRRAQRIHPDSRAWPWAPLRRNTSRSCSLSR